MRARVELLVGRKVVDRDGRKVGRIEEIVAQARGGDLVVTEYLVGTSGMAERLSIHHFGSWLTRVMGAYTVSADPHRIPWNKMDLSDPEHPRLTCSVEEL